MNPQKAKDLAWIGVVAVLVLVWSSIPNWTGYEAQIGELSFRGSFFDTQDYAVHIAMMNAGFHGELAYQFKFTTEPHNSAYIRLFYVILGHVSRLFGLELETAYQIARWILGLIALYVLYDLMRRIFTDIFWARTAFLLAALGSGIGWLQLILGWTPTPITPIDFWLIDCYVFFSLAMFPHFAFVTIGMCLILTLWFDFLDKQNWGDILLMAVISILVQFVNPIALATVDFGLAGAALFSSWRSRKFVGMDYFALFVLAIAQVPLFAYNFIILTNDPIWERFTAQNQTLSPPPVYYFLGFALFWLPAIIGIGVGFHNKQKVMGASIFWVVSGFALAYAPFFIQRRFLQNITIPLAILATQGLIWVFETGTARSPIWRRWRTNLIIVLIFLTSISSIQLSLGRAIFNQTHPGDLYYPSSIDDAASWLRNNAEYNDFVLASETTSQILAQKAGMRVYLGHEMETLDYKNKQKFVDDFFSGRLPQIASKPIEWVVYGPIERKKYPKFAPADNLELFYSSNDIYIYRIK